MALLSCGRDRIIEWTVVKGIQLFCEYLCENKIICKPLWPVNQGSTVFSKEENNFQSSHVTVSFIQDS